MKRLFLVIFLFFSVNQSFSQKYMDEIVQKTCECLNKMPEDITIQQAQMELGGCMLEASFKHKKDILKDFKVDLDNIAGADGEKLGNIVGVRLAAACPKGLLKLVDKKDVNVNAGNANDAQEEKVYTGTVTKIDEDNFVVVSLKDEQGKTTKFYWLTFVESASFMDLPNSYAELVGKKVKISSKTMDFFDPKIKEYRQFLIISNITSAL